jgi:hypothetical protein
MRSYDSSTGRFISQDPLVADNPYPFANNNPVLRTDPSGMDAAAEYSETEVYVVQDEAGNCYFGITKQGIWKRWLQHLKAGKHFFPNPMTRLTGFATRAAALQLEGFLIELFGGVGAEGLANLTGSAEDGPLGAEELMDIFNDIEDTILEACPGL